MSSSLPFGLKLKNTLKGHDLFHTLIAKVSGIIQRIPEYKDLKNNPEVVLLICNLVENLMSKNKTKMDKRDLVLCILDDLFDLNDEEKGKFSALIQYMYDNGQIVRLPMIRLLAHYVIDWIKRKLG